MTVPPSAVLIVDDNPFALKTLSATLRLRLSAVQVDTCESTVASLKRIRATEYDAILCKWRMPRMNGLALLRAVQKLRPITPVLLVADSEDQSFIAQAVEAGAYDLLVRPFETSTFLLSVKRAIETHHLRCQVRIKERKLIEGVSRVVRDLEALYGAYGLGAHFQALISIAKGEGQWV